MSSISLRISGNKLSNEGFRVLVSIGSPSPDIRDMMVMPGLVENDYYFLIRHELEQIVYTIQKTRIRSYGAARDGRLMMAIAIPRGFEVEAASPFEVLMDVYNTFVSHYTTDSLGGTQFSNAEIDTTLFQDIVDRYRLVPARNRYLPMSPERAAKAFVLLSSPKQISELMKDSQYAEFQSYGEIIVAREGSTGYPKLSIPVPRPVRFKVVVNNVPVKTEITSLTEPYTASANAGDCFEYLPVKFTLADLKSGKNPPEVKIDFQKETVFCTLAKRPKVQTWQLRLEGENPGYDQIRIRDKRSGEEIPVDAEGKFQLSGDQIASPLELVCRNPALVKSGNDVKDNVNRVFSGRLQKPAPIPKDGVRRAAASQNVSFQIQPTPFPDSQIELFLEKGQKKLKIPHVPVHNGYAVAEVPLHYFSPGPIKVYADSKNYDSFAQGGKIDLERETDVTLYLAKKGLLERPWLKMLAAGIAGLVIGCLIGWLCSSAVLKDSKSGETKGRKNAPPAPTEQEIKDAINLIKNDTLDFSSGDLTFEEVGKIITMSESVNDSNLKESADAYARVLQMIKKRESFDHDDFSSNGKVGHLLSRRVRAALQATYYGLYKFTEKTTDKYSPDEKTKAKEKYENGDFLSFKELYHIGEEIKQK